MRFRGIVIASLLALLGAGCQGSRGHDQLEGTYSFTLVETVLADNTAGCAEATDPTAWGGPLVRSGDYVRLDLGLRQLFAVGYYRYDLEEFSLDGSAQDVATDGTCVVDQIRVHVEAVTTSPTTFEGTMAIDYDDPVDACRCSFRALYRAERQ